MSATPIYTTAANVQVRLVNKVQFQADPNSLQDGELSNALFSQLIQDAETEVEQDLRVRYAIPFQYKLTPFTFKALPDHTQRAIRVACEYKAICKILDTDFGRGTHVNAAAYKEATEKAYNSYIDKLLGNERDDKGRLIQKYRRPAPLDGLLLDAGNSMADDGYSGMIINTDASQFDSASYAASQINDPGRTYINAQTAGALPTGDDDPL